MTKNSEAIRHCSTTVWWLSVSCFKGFCSGASATEANFALTVFALRIQRGCQSTGVKLVGTALCMAHMVLWAGILPLMGIQIIKSCLGRVTLTSLRPIHGETTTGVDRPCLRRGRVLPEREIPENPQSSRPGFQPFPFRFVY